MINTEEKKLSELLKKEVSEKLSDDFEARLMFKIEKLEKDKSFFIKNFSAAWFFFLVGTVSGAILTTIIAQVDLSFFGMSIEPLRFPILVSISIVLLFLMEKLVVITKSHFKNLKIRH